MFGTTPNQDEEDTLTRKEEARSRFRRPINELINEIGEGRGEFNNNDVSSRLSNLFCQGFTVLVMMRDENKESKMPMGSKFKNHTIKISPQQIDLPHFSTFSNLLTENHTTTLASDHKV